MITGYSTIQMCGQPGFYYVNTWVRMCFSLLKCGAKKKRDAVPESDCKNKLLVDGLEHEFYFSIP
jgi:hypothetical protein